MDAQHKNNKTAVYHGNAKLRRGHTPLRNSAQGTRFPRTDVANRQHTAISPLYSGKIAAITAPNSGKNTAIEE